MAVRIMRRDNGEADHYEYIEDGYDMAQILPEQDEATAAELREDRKGKKTVAIVGMAPSSCSLAPWNDLDVEIWGLNEMHAFKWVKRATRWFQIHNSSSWKRHIAKRRVQGHYRWLKENPWKIPIYLQYPSDEVPLSCAYPLHEICDKFFKNFRRGKMKIKYFTSSFAYMMGVALLDGFERIEIYGFEMADEIEYLQQKACAEFWIGLAMGMGVEIYTPPGNQLLYSKLYGGNEQGAGW
jgi:hypothetical protein